MNWARQTRQHGRPCSLRLRSRLRPEPDCPVERVRSFEPRALYARSGPALTRFKVAVDLIADSPIDGAMRLSVRQIGDGLFRVLQSPQKMMLVARRVCSLDEVRWSRRMTIINAAWEGIGTDVDGYWG